MRHKTNNKKQHITITTTTTLTCSEVVHASARPVLHLLGGEVVEQRVDREVPTLRVLQGGAQHDLGDARLCEMKLLVGNYKKS